jgi:hypothetical protein
LLHRLSNYQLTLLPVRLAQQVPLSPTAGEDEAAAVGVAAEPADVSPRLVT